MILISLLEITVINLWMLVGRCWCCGYNTVPHQHGENWMMLSYQWWKFYHPTPVVCTHVYAYCYCVPVCHVRTILYGTLQIQVGVRSQCTLKYWNCPRIYHTCSTFGIDYNLMVWWFWLQLPNLMYAKLLKIMCIMKHHEAMYSQYCLFFKLNACQRLLCVNSPYLLFAKI